MSILARISSASGRRCAPSKMDRRASWSICQSLPRTMIAMATNQCAMPISNRRPDHRRRLWPCRQPVARISLCRIRAGPARRTIRNLDDGQSLRRHRPGGCRLKSRQHRFEGLMPSCLSRCRSIGSSSKLVLVDYMERLHVSALSSKQTGRLLGRLLRTRGQ
jgi:hypothetical protein